MSLLTVVTGVFHSLPSGYGLQLYCLGEQCHSVVQLPVLNLRCLDKGPATYCTNGQYPTNSTSESHFNVTSHGSVITTFDKFLNNGTTIEVHNTATKVSNSSALNVTSSALLSPSRPSQNTTARGIDSIRKRTLANFLVELAKVPKVVESTLFVGVDTTLDQISQAAREGSHPVEFRRKLASFINTLADAVESDALPALYTVAKDLSQGRRTEALKTVAESIVAYALNAAVAAGGPASGGTDSLLLLGTHVLAHNIVEYIASNLQTYEDSLSKPDTIKVEPPPLGQPKPDSAPASHGPIPSSNATTAAPTVPTGPARSSDPTTASPTQSCDLSLPLYPYYCCIGICASCPDPRPFPNSPCCNGETSPRASEGANAGDFDNEGMAEGGGTGALPPVPTVSPGETLTIPKPLRNATNTSTSTSTSTQT